MRAPFWWEGLSWIAWTLLPLAWAWALAGRIRALVARPERASRPVVCIGNFVAGGAGKTPVAIALAQWLKEKNIAVHLVSRGYGGTEAGPLRVDPRAHHASQVGDEPLLLAEVAPCWVAKDRAKGVRAAIDGGARLVLLDDGMQNPNLYKDVSFAVVDAEYGIGNGLVMPAGPLREPLGWGMRRAQAVISIGGAWKRKELPVIDAEVRQQIPEALGRQPLVAFAGIGRPQKFFSMLIAAGLNVQDYKAYPDHYAYTQADLDQLAQLAATQRAALVTTRKDFVRLPETFRAKVTAVDMELTFSSMEYFERFILPLCQD